MGNSQRKYICSFCAKSFSRSEHRTRHERSHTGYKPFQCKICKHSFVRRDLVQRHIRTVHRVLLLASKKNGFDPQNDVDNIALKEGFTFIQNDKKKIEINDNKKKINKKSSKSKKDNDISDTTSNASTTSSSSSGSSSSDDQTIDDLVRQMIHVRDMPKESELEKLANTRKTNDNNNNNNNNQNSTNNNSSNSGSSSSSSCNGNNGITSISNSTSSSATAVSDMNDDKTHLFTENILNLNNKTSLLHNDGDNTILKQLYLNPVNDSFNSHLSNNVIGKFNLSYYSDQLLKNFNFGMTALRDNQIFLNSIRRIYEVCNYDNDKFFNVSWVAKREGILPILGVSISCLGNFVKNNVYDQNLWILCWNQAMNSSSEFGKPDILSISILIYIIIRTPQCDKTCLDVYQFFQQSLLYMINQLDSSKTIVDSIDIKSFDIWNIFDIWVLLTKITDTFDNASSIIYKWFLKQNNLFTGFSELTLYDFLNSRSYVIEEKLSLATLNILPDTLYCEANNTLFNTTRNIFSVGSFKSTEDLHNLIIKINQKFSNLTIKKIISETADTLGTKKGNDHLMNVHDPNFNLLFQDWKKNVLLLNAPVKFSELLIDYAILPQSNNHWLLWECTWFEFLKSLSPADLVYKKTSFLKLQVLQSIYLDGTMINNNLALCTTPIIALLENHSKNADLFPIDNRFVTLIVDILAFQLKFFSTELVSSQLNGPAHIMGFLANPMVQLILYVWFSVIYKDDKGSYVTTSVESESVIRFVEKYIIDKDKKLDTDKLLEQDINEILFNNRSPEFIGFHCLIDSIGSYIKDEVIIKRLFPLPSLNQETRFKLFEFLKLYEKDEPEMTSAPMVKTPSYSHRPSISSIGSNPFNLPTSPTSCTPTSKRRSSVVSMTEDGQKLLLPPLNFVPGQLLASPSNKRNSIPNSNYFENPGPKVPLGTYNDTFGNVPQPILHSGNPNILNHLNNYSYGGKNNGNHQEFGKINGSSNLYAYDNDTRPSGKWLHSRRASLPALSSNKPVGAPMLPSVFPVIVNGNTIGEAQPLRPTDRLNISKDRMSNERSTHN